MPTPSITSPHRPRRFLRLIAFSAFSFFVILFALSNLFLSAQAQPAPSDVRPSTKILQNRSEQGDRVEDQNQLLYGGGNPTNAASTNAPPGSPATPVPSGDTAPKNLTGPATNTTVTPALPATTTVAPVTPAVSGTETGSVMPPSSEEAPTAAETELNDLLKSSHDELPTRKITQAQALSQALSQNYDIQIKTYDVTAAQGEVRQAHGAFDPVLSAEISYENIRDPQNTQDFVATGGTPLNILSGQPRIFVENNEHYKLSLSGKLPTGTTYEVKTQMDVLQNTLNKTSPLALFTPEYQSFTGVTIDQPLMRGFGTDVNNSEIRAAIVNKLVSRYELQDAMLATVSQVLQSYNQLSYLTEELEAKHQDRELGIKLVQDRLKSLERGQISSRELNRAESSLAEIIEDYTKAHNEVINQQTALQALLSSQTSDIGQFTYLPVSKMPTLTLHQSVEELLVEALAHRPKYLEAKAKVEEQNIKLVYARDQKWPQLDLKASYGVNGMSGSYGNSYYREIIPQGPQWSVGLLFSVPFGLNDAGGKFDEIVARKAQTLLALKQIELNTDLVIRKLVATIHSDQDRLNAMRLFSKTADDNYNQEQTRLEKGLSTDLDVLKYHRDFTESQARERAAQADLNNAFVQLREVTGTLLDDSNVHLQQ